MGITIRTTSRSNGESGSGGDVKIDLNGDNSGV